jgi:addiction module RelB/DinJ family antitoxin
MQTAQINLKIEPQLKKKSQAVAQKLGFNLSNVLRAFLINFTDKQEINFSLKKEERALSSKEFAQGLIKAGHSKKEAEAEARDYQGLLDARENGTLIRVL